MITEMPRYQRTEALYELCMYCIIYRMLNINGAKCTLYIVHCTEYNIQCTVYTMYSVRRHCKYNVHCTVAVHIVLYTNIVLFSVYCALCIIYVTYNVHCTTYTVFTVYSVHCTLYSVQCTVYSIHYTISGDVSCLSVYLLPVTTYISRGYLR